MSRICVVAGVVAVAALSACPGKRPGRSEESRSSPDMREAFVLRMAEDQEVQVRSTTTYMHAHDALQLSQSVRRPLCRFVVRRNMPVYADEGHTVLRYTLDTGYFPVLEEKGEYVRTVILGRDNAPPSQRYEIVYIPKGYLGMDWRTSDEARTPGRPVNYVMVNVASDLCPPPPEFMIDRGFWSLRDEGPAIAPENDQE